MNLHILHRTGPLGLGGPTGAPGPAGASVVDSTVNGNVIRRGYDVAAAHGGSWGWNADVFTVPAASLTSGRKNTLRIALQPGATSHYSVEWIAVDEVPVP